ncbi:hypothetical protein [Shewanella surugensis]|uniref:Uncharacterized protein n=1 Tax=Shewanella surugensis TaxID=212020 RepID=A0ABT0LBY2_9GAMM|nr:hypothetical protein [Shewanella surugensis]MCL1125208.1 hypothetical protein [Shewanella surugensis]
MSDTNNKANNQENNYQFSESLNVTNNQVEGSRQASTYYRAGDIYVINLI